MPFVGRPKATKTLPRSLPQPAVGALLEAVDGDHASQRRTDWAERDLALILTGLLAGLRADELRRADVGDVRTSSDGGAVIHVRGTGSKDSPVPIEIDLLAIIEDYLDSRYAASPPPRDPQGDGVFRDGRRTPRCSWAATASGSPAEPYIRVSGAPSRALAQTPSRCTAPSFTSSNSGVSVYTLMKLLGHESMATSQRYVTGAARETRTAAAQNPLYGIIHDRLHRSNTLDGDNELKNVFAKQATSLTV